MLLPLPWVNAAEGTGGSNRARALSAWQRAGFLSPVVNQEQPHDKASCRAHPALIRPPSPRHLPRLRHHRRRGNLSPGRQCNPPLLLLDDLIVRHRPPVWTVSFHIHRSDHFVSDWIRHSIRFDTPYGSTYIYSRRTRLIVISDVIKITTHLAIENHRCFPSPSMAQPLRIHEADRLFP